MHVLSKSNLQWNTHILFYHVCKERLFLDSAWLNCFLLNFLKTKFIYMCKTISHFEKWICKCMIVNISLKAMLFRRMFQSFVVIMFNSWCIEYLYGYIMHMKLTCISCIFSLPVDVPDLQSYISSLCKFWMLSPVFPVPACLHISCQMDFINFSQMKYGLLYATALNISPLIFHCIPLSSLGLLWNH